MKRCPQCGAEYDNHVEFCFVDGTELSQLQTQATSAVTPTPAIQPRSRVAPLLLLGIIFLVATPLVVVGLVYVLGIDGAPATTEDIPRLDEPVVEAPEPRAVQVRIDSIPEGAEVWEGNTLLCAPTPCAIEQPDHAPAVRELELRMVGYAPTPVPLDKSHDSLQVPMVSARQAPRSAPTAAQPRTVTEPAPPTEDPDQAGPGIIQER